MQTQKGRDMFVFEIIGAVMIGLSLCALVRNDAKMSR